MKKMIMIAAGFILTAAPLLAQLNTVWVQRYMSVCYPLRRMKVNSPYGYRKDPFTGKRKFHNGVDLHARGDEALAMMEGTVLKVGQDRISGKYVVLRHGEFTVSYCHLSRILVSKGPENMWCCGTVSSPSATAIFHGFWSVKARLSVRGMR